MRSKVPTACTGNRPRGGHQQGLRTRFEEAQVLLREAQARVAQAERAKAAALLEVDELEQSRAVLQSAIDPPPRPPRSFWPLMVIAGSAAVPWLVCSQTGKQWLVLGLATLVVLIPIAAVAGLIIGLGRQLVAGLR